MPDNDLNGAAGSAQSVDLETTIQALKEDISKGKAFVDYLEAMGQFCWATYVRPDVHRQEKELKELEAQNMKAAEMASER